MQSTDTTFADLNGADVLRDQLALVDLQFPEHLTGDPMRFTKPSEVMRIREKSLEAGDYLVRNMTPLMRENRRRSLDALRFHRNLTRRPTLVVVK